MPSLFPQQCDDQRATDDKLGERGQRQRSRRGCRQIRRLLCDTGDRHDVQDRAPAGGPQPGGDPGAQTAVPEEDQPGDAAAAPAEAPGKAATARGRSRGGGQRGRPAAARPADAGRRRAASSAASGRLQGVLFGSRRQRDEHDSHERTGQGQPVNVAPRGKSRTATLFHQHKHTT